MAEHVRAVTTNSMEAEKLFDKYTIDEIREIEKKTRQNIERKKEDLRQMVGERYRDVIEAADTITDMKHIAQNVSVSLTKMQDLCHSLERSLPAKSTYHKPIPKFKKTKVNPLYGVSAEMKLLLEMPEKIWSALERGSILRATQLFLLARHVHTSLQLSPSGAALVRSCPLLSLQWAAISQLRANILSAARQALRDTGRTDHQATTDCLVSILLLEDSTPTQVFNQFLQARMAAIKDEFHASSQSVKSTMCSVVRIIVSTLHQVYTVFCPDVIPGEATEDSKCNLLIDTVDTVTSSGNDGVILQNIQYSSPAMKYLPATVLDFRPATKNKMAAVPLSTLRSKCNEWIEGCKTELGVGVTACLGYLGTVRGVAGARDALWALLAAQTPSDAPDTPTTASLPPPAAWARVAQHLLGKDLSVWDHFLRQLFLQRTKALLQSQVDTALSNTQQQVGRVLGELGAGAERGAEHDVAAYVWTEGAGGDIVASMAWIPATSQPSGGGGSDQHTTAPLAMKARAYTPAVQSLCRSFDGKLRALLEDSRYYMQTSDDDTTTTPSPTDSSQSDAPFEQYGDRAAVEEYMHQACTEAVHKLLKHLEQQLYASKQQLSNSQDPTGNQLIIDRVLVLGRLVTALPDLCANLRVCAVGEQTQAQPKSFKKSVLGRSSKQRDDPRWTELKGKLTAFSQDAYRVWSEHMCRVLLAQFQAALLSTSGHAVLLSSTKWDDVEIEEETETGSKVRSTIRVPMQPSCYVHSVLYSLCQQINRVGGHALRKSTIQHLVEEMSGGMIGAYEKYLADTKGTDDILARSQNRALQLWFDVKFLGNLMPPSKEQEKAVQRRVERIIDELESLVDPFDLDVFTPYMKNHLTRQTQRCHVLYGALNVGDTASASASTVSLSRAPASSHQEQHNLLPLSSPSSSSQRFPLLPLSTTRSSSASGGQSTAVAAAPIIAPPKPQTSPLHATPLVPPSPARKATAANQADSSFFGQMSTIWFSNVAK